MKDQTLQQELVPDELIGLLPDWPRGLDDPVELRRRLHEDGFVLLRGVLNTDDVLAARAEVFGRLEAVGEIRPPAIEGIASGESCRRETVDDLGAFWRSVSEGPALRYVSHGERLREIMAVVLDEPVRPHDLMYLRPTPVGRSTRLHYDFPFFAGGSNRILTAWIPLGDVPRSDGTLVIIEGSNRFFDLIEPIRDIDYARDRSNDVVQQAAYERQDTSEPVTLVGGRGSRFLTTDFRAGDLLVFGGFTMHGSFDNHSPQARVRLSVDVRYQPAGDPTEDERDFGPNPRGSKGGGYGDMKGAQPLTEPW